MFSSFTLEFFTKETPKKMKFFLVSRRFIKYMEKNTLKQSLGKKNSHRQNC